MSVEGPHGGGGGGHHGGGGGRRLPAFGRQYGFDVNRGWPYYVDPFYPPLNTVETCASWGSPIALTPELRTIGERLLTPSAGLQPASAYHNGVLYLFSVENGVPTVRPCAAKSVGTSGCGCGAK